MAVTTASAAVVSAAATASAVTVPSAKPIAPPLLTTRHTEPASGPCPAEMSHIGGFCVDRWEAHLVTVADDGTKQLHPHYERPREGVSYQARSAPSVFPQAYISKNESARACKAAGKRLCHWIEWRRACQGRRWLRYPYGNGARKGACNIAKDHQLREMFGNDPGRWKYEDHFNSPQLNQNPGFLARTGAHEQCASPDGIYDMAGNVHEWVHTKVTSAFVRRIEEEGVERDEQPWQPGNAMFLGGFYSTIDELGPGCHYTTLAHGPNYHDYSTGFRCCADATVAP